MVNLGSVATQVNLENQEILVTLVDQENLGIQEDLVKMVLTEISITVLSVLMYMHMRESLATQENQDNVETLDLEDPLDHQVMMPSAILENMVKMVNPEGLDTLEKMVHLENPAILVLLEIMLI